MLRPGQKRQEMKKRKTRPTAPKRGLIKKNTGQRNFILFYTCDLFCKKMPRLKRNVRTETNNQPETSADKGDGEETTSCQNTKPKVSHDFIPCLHNITHPPDLTALLLKYMSSELRTMSTQDFCRKVSLWHKKKLHVDDRWKLGT